MTRRRTPPPPPRDFDLEPPTPLETTTVLFFVVLLPVLYGVNHGSIKLYDAFKIIFYFSIVAAFVAFVAYAHVNGVRFQEVDKVFLLNGAGMLALWTAEMPYLAMIEGAIFVVFMMFGYRRTLVHFEIQPLVQDYDVMLETRKRFGMLLYTKFTTVVWPVVYRAVADHWFHALMIWFVVQLAWHYRTELVEIVSEMFEFLKDLVRRVCAWLGPYADWVRAKVVDALESVRRVVVEFIVLVADYARHAVEMVDRFVREFVTFMYESVCRFVDALLDVFRDAWRVLVRYLHVLWDLTAAMREFFGRMWIQFKHLLWVIWDAIEWLAQKMWLALCELVHPSIRTMGAVMFVLMAEYCRRRLF